MLDYPYKWTKTKSQLPTEEDTTGGYIWVLFEYENHLWEDVVSWDDNIKKFINDYGIEIGFMVYAWKPYTKEDAIRLSKESIRRFEENA